MAKPKVVPEKKVVVKRKPNFVLSKAAKMLLSAETDIAKRSILKSLLIDSEISYSESEWVVMNYEVGPGGKRQSRPKKD